MARFPLKEAEVVALAEAMETGLTANVAIYPAPPVAPLDLTTLKNNYITASNAAIAAGFLVCVPGTPASRKQLFPEVPQCRLYGGK